MDRSKDRSLIRDCDKLGRSMRTLDEIEDDEALAAAKEIKRLAQFEVDLYIKSEDFKLMIERMKQREREKILHEIEEELRDEKIIILAQEKKKLQDEIEKLKTAEEIKLQNQWMIEEMQRKANSDRLLEIQKRQLEDKLLKEDEEKAKKEIINNDQGRTDGKKFSLALKKKAF